MSTLSILNYVVTRPSVRKCVYRARFMSTVLGNEPEIRERLMAGVKAAMKERDSLTSTVLRSVLSEIQAADKAANSKIASSAILALLRKAVVRRNDAAIQFTSASRPDLAERELLEAALLNAYLPPLLSESDIDQLLQGPVNHILAGEKNLARAKGKIFKVFYDKVDKSMVDAAVVKRRVDVLVASKAS